MGRRAEDESDAQQPDTHTRKPTLVVCDQFSICHADQMLNLAIRRVLFLSRSRLACVTMCPMNCGVEVHLADESAH